VDLGPGEKRLDHVSHPRRGGFGNTGSHGGEFVEFLLGKIPAFLALRNKVHQTGLEPVTFGSVVAPSSLDALGTLRKCLIYQGVTLSLLFGNASVKVRFRAYAGG
jgi:hypothetical protein